MHIRDDFPKYVLHIINTPQKIPHWHAGMLSVLLQLSQLWQYVISCVSLTTSTTKQWGKNEPDTCWPGGKNVPHKVLGFIQKQWDNHPNGVFMVPIRLFAFPMLVWLNSLELEHTNDIIQWKTKWRDQHGIGPLNFLPISACSRAPPSNHLDVPLVLSQFSL